MKFRLVLPSHFSVDFFFHFVDVLLLVLCVRLHWVPPAASAGPGLRRVNAGGTAALTEEPQH